MDRRSFLRQLGLASAGLGLLRGGLLTASGSGDPWLSDFRAARSRHDWLAGWESFDGEILPERKLRWRGRPPRGLRGTLYRNGPARFERGGKRYQHWFDGDGLVQAWRFGEGSITHRGRMVGTDKFRAEQQAGRFLRQAAGTWIDGAEPMRGTDDINPANTSVMMLRDRLYALWEGGSAWELDPDDLGAKGPRTWRDDLAGAPFSAHPLRERDGSLWNVGLAAYASTPTLLVWHIGADGELASITPVELDLPGYLHAFAMTERHLVLIISPWLYDHDGDGAFFQRLRWRPEHGSQAIVLDKDALDAPRRHALPGGLSFHYGNAWQARDAICLHACWIDDVDATNRALSGLMRGEVPAAAQDDDPLVRIELPLSGSGDGRVHRLPAQLVEFPTWDDRHVGADGKVYMAQQQSRRAPYFDGICAWDGRRERLDSYHYGEGWLVEEHLFVARADAARRDRGWLLGTALDSRRGQLHLSVFDAGHLGAGPICQAALPHSLPLGFHGCFARA